VKRILDNVQIVTGISAERFAEIQSLIDETRPNVVVNCIGVVKQLAAAQDHIASITINGLFPHQLALACRAAGSRLITLSTDCVFSGRKGDYDETDLPDPVDTYGRSKLVGEVSGEGCLTVRTSMIGRQLAGSHSLVEWFLTQSEPQVKGYKKAIFSGLTTNALAELIARIIEEQPQLSGIWQVAAKPISKFDLLSLIKEVYKLPVIIKPDTDYVCDRSLNGDKFRAATAIAIPDWTDMITQMYKDPTPYQDGRIAHVN
jgi:dTDP-4-dehydrorhamnose reductase